MRLPAPEAIFAGEATMGIQGGRHGRPNVIGTDKRIGPREAQIVHVIAGRPQPVSVRDIYDRLLEGGYLEYQGVWKCMDRMARKGLLEQTAGAGHYLYTSRVDLDKLTADVVLDILQQLGADIDRVICLVLRVDPEVGVKAIARLRRRAARAAGRIS
jgi:predicted transcriptional regulator